MRKQLITAALLTCCVSSVVAVAADGDAANSINVGPNTTVGGLTYFDFSYLENQSQAANGLYSDVNPTGTGFDVKRFYLIVDHRFDDIWSADLTTDANYVTATTSSITTTTSSGTTKTTVVTNANSGGVTEVYIKKLYLQGAFSDAFKLDIGSSNLPWIPFEESLWGFRWVDKTALDRLGLGTTADWGLNANGQFVNGLVTYALAAVNGGGYKNPTRTKDVDWEGRLSVAPVQWLTLAAGFYDGHLGQVTQSVDDYPNHAATRWDLLANVAIAGVHVGGEYFEAKNYKTVNSLAGGVWGTSAVIAASATGVLPTDEAAGYTIWASYYFTPSWYIFGRTDQVKLSEDVDTGLKDSYFHVGAGFKPIKSIDVALVYKNEKVTDGSVSVSGSDGNSSITIGGANGHTDGKYDEYGIYTQWTF